MKHSKPILLIVMLAAMLMLAACRTAPIYNVHNVSFNASQTPLSLDEITGAIVKAGAGLGWDMSVVTPGHIQATLNIRAHQAVVDITYNEHDYSINYKSSSNLKYDGTNIHSNYNGWIKNLRTAINNQIASAQYK